MIHADTHDPILDWHRCLVCSQALSAAFAGVADHAPRSERRRQADRGHPARGRAAHRPRSGIVIILGRRVVAGGLIAAASGEAMIVWPDIAGWFVLAPASYWVLHFGVQQESRAQSGTKASVRRTNG